VTRASNIAVLAASLATAVVLSGCAPEAMNRVGHYTAPRRDIVSLRRVAFLPLANETDHPGTETGLTEELFKAVQASRLFHLRPVPTNAVAATELPNVGTAPLTLADLARLRGALGADGILTGALTRWQPYPRMQMGLYLRLVDLRTGRVLWAIDHVWDATDEHTQHRLRQFFCQQAGEGTEPFGWELGTVSLRAFQKFIAHEVAQTLPCRPTAKTEVAAAKL